MRPEATPTQAEASQARTKMTAGATSERAILAPMADRGIGESDTG